MLYVSKYDKAQDKYGVTDTDDGTTELVSSGELFSIVRTMRVKVQGVDLSQMRIRVVSPEGEKKKASKPQKTKTRLEYLEMQIGFDYVLEQHDARDFTEFVISTGGDVCKYRVHGYLGSYRLTAK